MRKIVITGATRGIGFGLAGEFLKRGHDVMISGRSQESIDRALSRLKPLSDRSTAEGAVCDVRHLEDVEKLWSAAAEQLGHVDIWINNAGIGHSTTPTWELSPELVSRVIETNLTGTYNGCRTAVRKMHQQGFGAVYNMEGYGSDGKARMGLSIYGATKSAIRFLSDSLVAELKGTPILLGTLQPGMVATDMVKDQYADRPEDWERVKKIFNIFIETVESVSPPLVEKILANTRQGARIRAFPRSRLYWHFLTAPFSKRTVLK